MRIAAILFAAGLLLWGQPAPAEFEAASVRVNKLDDRIVDIRVGPGGRFMTRGYTLVLLMQRAYGVMDWNVAGGPAWIRTARFDVNAVAPGVLTEAALQPMLRKLLADRFQLRIHEETREMAGYSLQVARGGPKVKASGAKEDRDAFRMNRQGLEGEGIRMADFARFVAGKTGAIAIDQTGLTGLFDFKTTWKLRLEDLPAGADPRDEYREAVFAAVEDQLGLKFVRQRIPVRTLVIERVEMPSDN